MYDKVRNNIDHFSRAPQVYPCCEFHRVLCPPEYNIGRSILNVVTSLFTKHVIQFPDQESCSAVVLPTIAIFSLPDVLLTTQEGEDVQVCVTKEGETEQSSVVTIFTQEIAGQARSESTFSYTTSSMSSTV